MYTGTHGMACMLTILCLFTGHCSCQANKTISSLTLKSVNSNSPYFTFSNKFTKSKVSFEKLSISKLTSTFAFSAIPLTFKESHFSKCLSPILKMNSQSISNTEITSSSEAIESITFTSCTFNMNSEYAVSGDPDFSITFLKCTFKGHYNFLSYYFGAIYVNDSAMNDVTFGVSFSSTENVEGNYFRNNITNTKTDSNYGLFALANTQPSTVIYNVFDQVESKYIFSAYENLNVYATTILNTKIYSHDILAQFSLDVADSMFLSELQNQDSFHIEAKTLRVRNCCFSGGEESWFTARNLIYNLTNVPSNQCDQAVLIRDFPYKVHKSNEVIFKMLIRYTNY